LHEIKLQYIIIFELQKNPLPATIHQPTQRDDRHAETYPPASRQQRFAYDIQHCLSPESSRQTRRCVVTFHPELPVKVPARASCKRPHRRSTHRCPSKERSSSSELPKAFPVTHRQHADREADGTTRHTSCDRIRL